MTLSEAIEGLYATFRAYPLRPVVDFCSHCITAAEEKRLHEAPLRQLNNRAFQSFAGSVPWTWGTVDDLKHFLPRLFELALMDDRNYPDVSEWFYRLGRLGWQSWPEVERAALERFGEAYWRAIASDCFDLLDGREPRLRVLGYSQDIRETLRFRCQSGPSVALGDLAVLVNGATERLGALDATRREAVLATPNVYDLLLWLESDGLRALEGAEPGMEDAGRERALRTLREGFFTGLWHTA